MDPHDDELALASADGDGGLVRPVLWPASGRYAWTQPKSRKPAHPARARAVGRPPGPQETLALDVDGRYPQLAVSGTINGYTVGRIHWVARLRKLGRSRWKGPVWYRQGPREAFPYTTVEVVAIRSKLARGRSAKVTFTGGGAPRRTVSYKFVSAAFRTVNLEFDFQVGEVADTEIDTCAHPVRPASLPCEKLTIPMVLRRAGCAVSTNRSGSVPSPRGATWSDMEMHDAMQLHWSRFADRAQWAMWVFYASLHETGTDLGGIMFDDLGPNHRQGTALFVDSFIASRRRATPPRPRGSTGCGSGRRCTSWATPSTSPTPGRSRSAPGGCRSPTSPRRAAS